MDKDVVCMYVCTYIKEYIYIYNEILYSHKKRMCGPRESQGWGSLVGCHLWGHTESDTTEVT